MDREIQSENYQGPFSQFAKSSNSNRPLKNASKTVVAYTRVSGKEQEKNMSLPYQRQIIDEYATRQGLHIVAYFGGKYESAQSDGRKEFQRMLDYIKNSKVSISQILVYTVDRFSRTGGSAIKLAQDLRDKYGVSVNAISQPTDMTNPSGIFQQNIQFLFSNYDNVLRRQRAIAGMTYKLERGNWVVKPPIGYDAIRINGVRKLEINETGKKLKKAFDWKSQGVKNTEILLRLNSIGLKLLKQKLAETFKNPFYCGLICHGMLQGKIVEGIHEPLVSKEVFLRINQIMNGSGQYGVPHFKENTQLPLKIFVKCDECKVPMTGYLVKKKNLYYYKCRTKGCKCNIRNIRVHEAFETLLAKYAIKPELEGPLKIQLEQTFEQLSKGKKENEVVLNSRLAEINKKIDRIEEKYFALNEMDLETFQKFNVRFKEERDLILSELEKCSEKSSNLAEGIRIALQISAKIKNLWASANYSIKEKLQKLVFPEGIYYNRQNDVVRTTNVNPIFELIAQLTGSFDKTKTGQTQCILDLSRLAGRTGLEPATSAVTGRHSNQLNYRPG